MPLVTEAANDVDISRDRAQPWKALLGQYGLRATSARVVILEALDAYGHDTPELIHTHVARSLPTVNVSTVYRTLEVLAEHGVVAHSHLAEQSVTYMLASHADHAHLVCRGCRQVLELDSGIAGELTGRISRAHGFDVDTGHLSVFGRCSSCINNDT